MLAKKRILLVEDDDVDRLRVHRALARLAGPIELVDAVNVAEAHDALEQQHFDCLVVDYNLPDGTALDVLTKVAEADRSMPVVVLTGETDEELALGALQLGAEDYLSKANFHGETFVRSVRYAIERHRLHRQLQETNARLARELEVGGGIQTSILPRELEVAGFAVAAKMQPATEVGGDYYDVIPVADGCWIGVGDVAGHGMSAAIVMLMAQSGVAALVRREPSASPSELVCLLNEVLHDNVRKRMGHDEHVTLTLLRLERSGRVSFAGAHEDILVLRAKSGRVEQIETAGTWLAVRGGIADVTEDQELVLEPDDVMVLHSDGVTEAQNDAGERFGLERLCRLLEGLGGQSALEVHRTLWEAVASWCASPDDDVTLLVVRRQGLTDRPTPA